MAEATQTPGQPATPEEQNPLDAFGREATDRLEHSTEIVSIMSEIRALTGQAIGYNYIPPVAAPMLPPVIPVGAHRMNPLQPNLNADQALDMIGHVVGHLYSDTRHQPEVRTIERAMRQRFQEILRARVHQGSASADRVNESIVVGRALLDAVYEQIKETDLERIAANVAAQLPLLPPPLPQNIVPTALRDYYRDPHTHRLTAEGLRLLNRLRSGGANPGKVLLAFSAALDTDYFDPHGGNLSTMLNPSPTRLPRINLQTEVLGAGEANMTSDVYRGMSRIAEAVEAYSAVQEDKLIYAAPMAPLAGTRSDDEFQRNRARFDQAVGHARTVRAAVQNLSNYFVGTPSHDIPESLAGGFDAAHILALLASVCTSPAGAPPPDSVPRALEVRNIIATAFGGRLRPAAEYVQEANRREDERGLTGTDACNKILGEYIRRVGGVDERTAAKGLSSLTGRVKVAEQMIREQGGELATVYADRDSARSLRAFKKGNRYARISRGNELLPWRNRNAYRLFLAELNRRDTAGLAIPNQPMSPGNTLDMIQNRYYTLWYLTRVLPDGDEKKLPMTPKLADELTQLRKAIVERHLRNISVAMARKGIDKLKKEDVDRMGLQGSNIEDLPFEDLQDRLYGMLDSTTLPPDRLQRTQSIVARAWAPLGTRKARRTPPPPGPQQTPEPPKQKGPGLLRRFWNYMNEDVKAF
jgi:hypothetical protein